MAVKLAKRKKQKGETKYVRVPIMRIVKISLSGNTMHAWVPRWWLNREVSKMVDRRLAEMKSYIATGFGTTRCGKCKKVVEK